MSTRNDREQMIAAGTTTVEAELAFVENKLQQAIRERDEARREVCEWEHHWDKTSSEQYYADKRGWDCFKDNA
jgi:hypothetical protein